jgi:hypothetical protein
VSHKALGTLRLVPFSLGTALEAHALPQLVHLLLTLNLLQLEPFLVQRRKKGMLKLEIRVLRSPRTHYQQLVTSQTLPTA